MEKLVLILLVFLLFSCKNNSVSIVDKESVEMANIELLGQREGNAAFFTVDTSVLYVPLLNSVDGYYEDADGKQVFTKGDNFEILSYTLVLPLCFDIFETQDSGDLKPPQITLYYSDSPYTSQMLFKNLWLPWGNYEMNLGEFFDFPKTISDDFKLKSVLNVSPGAINISMIGVPSELDGLKFHCPSYLKIRHTIDLK